MVVNKWLLNDNVTDSFQNFYKNLQLADVMSVKWIKSFLHSEVIE